MRIRDSKLIRGLRKPSVPREGEISPFWRVISFQRSMRINHGLEPFDNSVGGRRGKGKIYSDGNGWYRGDVLPNERRRGRRKKRVIIWFPVDSISSILSRLELIDYFRKLIFIEFIFINMEWRIQWFLFFFIK